MSASIKAGTSGLHRESLTATCRRLRQLGFDDPAAANLPAFKSGFRLNVDAWSGQELTHILVPRELPSACRIERRVSH
jgi:hypothetical protein